MVATEAEQALTVIAGEEFRRLCASWATGVAVVTTRTADGRSAALTMNAVTSLSLDPPLMLVCIAKTSDSLDSIRRSGAFCINILASGQDAVSTQCAGKGANKLAGIASHAGVTGSIVIDGALVAMECRVIDEYDGGDHRIFVGEVVAGYDSPGEPLVYYRGTYGTF